jgi:dipeptidyl aminopeptidase/acylaminoacyl peptidase
MVITALQLLAMTLAGSTPTPVSQRCARMLMERLVQSGRSVIEDDLVRLRDIGSPVAPSMGDEVFTVSPDGGRAAFQVHQADPDRNGYCVALVVVELRHGARPVMVDIGHELAAFSNTNRGRLGFPYGFARTVTPRWSPDGSQVAYVKQEAGTMQAWQAAADGSGARQLTSGPAGVDDVRYAPDGGTLVLSTRPDVPRRRAALEAEGLTGHRYDTRFAPMLRLAPFPSGPAPTSYWALILERGEMRRATGSEVELFTGRVTIGTDPGTTLVRSSKGDAAIVEPQAGGLLQRRQRMRVRRADGSIVECRHEACGSHIVNHWWAADGSQVEYLRREGATGEISTIYRWRPGAASPTQAHNGPDLLFSCAPAGERVACARETSTRPRHIALIDVSRGKLETAFNPNPEFGHLRLGRVERMQITDAYGARLFADLVYPVGHRRGAKYPLVVVQYDSRGFLRGGTGDEYPIQALAGRGVMVLSMNRPVATAYAPDARTGIDIDRANLKGFTLRRAVHSGIVGAIGRLVARGLVDPTKVGLTGLSEGSSAVQWALIHDTRFAAAAMSGCCWGPQTMPLTGLAAARDYRYKGYPSWANPEGNAFWRELSLTANAHKVGTPLLIQASDGELLEAIDGYTALQAADAPVDLLVFPGENHVKLQPAHRLAIYRRNVEWFSFWLGGQASHPDLPTWLGMREKRGAADQALVPDWSTPVPQDQRDIQTSASRSEKIRARSRAFEEPLP